MNNHNENHNHEINHDTANNHEELLKKIKEGQISMRPKVFFTLKVALLCLVALFILLISAFIISFIFFGLVISGRMLLLGFGFRGILLFILAFPWLLFAIDILLMASLDWLLKKFTFGYRSPLLYLVVGSSVIVIAAGCLITTTSIHRDILHREERKNPMPLFGPMLGGFYHGLRTPPKNQGVFRGNVISTTTDGFILSDEKSDNDSDFGIASTTDIGIATGTDFKPLSGSQDLRVVLPPEIQTAGFIQIGDRVFIAGDIVGNEIHAFGITKVATSSDDEPAQ